MSSGTNLAIAAETPLFVVLHDPHAREVIDSYLPGFLESPLLHTVHSFPIGLVFSTEPALEDSPERQIALLDALADIDTTTRTRPAESESFVKVSLDYEDLTVPAGSAALSASATVAAFDRFEARLTGPTHGNPFVDVDLSARIAWAGGSVTVPGFYDGNGEYVLRFMPEAPGEYTLLTSSNARSLDQISTAFTVTSARLGIAGPVRVAHQFHFAHADGTPYRPIGTTSYVWTHQGDELEEQTLSSLSEGYFNKMRMCVFPKSYLFNTNEPERFPFLRQPDNTFDYQRPDPEYWAHLEKRIEQLGELGIEADLILFHAYDRWGFATMPAVADDRYVTYAVARLAAFRNVWWSLANEYDLLLDKTEEDWERFAQIVTDNDPSRHLLSIHNCHEFYDHTRPWITHASIQRRDIYKTAEMTTEWRDTYGKPVVIDECAYEGNIDQGWGNITGQEMTRRAWEGAIRGGYVGHGETYIDPEDVLWWAKGGKLHGTSAARFGFLREILDDGPTALEPNPLDWDTPRAGTEGEYLLYYFGFNQPVTRRFLLDPRHTYSVEIIDTWDMTIETLPGIYRGRFRIDLPGRPYIAVRLRAVATNGE